MKTAYQTAYLETLMLALLAFVLAVTYAVGMPLSPSLAAPLIHFSLLILDTERNKTNKGSEDWELSLPRCLK